MSGFRRVHGDEERRRRRRHELDDSALQAATQTLFDTWPWLTEQYRQGAVTELPTEPVAAAIRRYMEHAGL